MQIEIKPLPAGLYFVSTPIGAARDITLRALDVLASADVLAAEDTRTLRKLMDIHGVALKDRPLIAYHDHNGPAQRPRILAALKDGRSVAYASEAGTPLVADPGFVLARETVAAGHKIIAAPGPSAAIAALTVSALPSDRFFFAGFTPTGGGARRTALDELAKIPGTVILYESPKRVHKLLDAMVQSFGGERQGVICRELTKKFEEIMRGTLSELTQEIAGRTLKGEIVVLVDRAEARAATPQEIEEALVERLKTMSVKDAAADVAKVMGLARRDVYQAALALGKND